MVENLIFLNFRANDYFFWLSFFLNEQKIRKIEFLWLFSRIAVLRYWKNCNEDHKIAVVYSKKFGSSKNVNLPQEMQSLYQPELIPRKVQSFVNRCIRGPFGLPKRRKGTVV
jgi:hypothetical protein